MKFTTNSVESLNKCIDDIKELWHQHRYLDIKVRIGKDRSLDQNAVSHCWYEQLAREHKEYNALGYKCFSKYTFGLPILCAEDEEYRDICDMHIKRLLYEDRILSMKYWPTTSLMTRKQMTAYLEAMQQYFITKGVMLKFPEE